MNQNLILIGCIVLLMALQITASCTAKWGSLPKGHYWWSVIIANLVTLPVIFLNVIIYRHLPASIAASIMTGGTFVCCQVALLCVFREPISLKRWTGIAIITLGVILASMSQ